MTQNLKAAVAYYRVSTDAQATFGYSLEAQQSLVRKYISEMELQLISEHTEAESGFGPAKLEKRPSLKRALQDCKRHKARLVISALDRLARNVVFIATLVETRVDFVALDLPDATPFMIHIYAAIAEEESRKKGEIIRAALILAKARGKDWGQEGRRRAAASQARAERLRPIIDEIRASGITGAYPIARELRRRGVPNTLNAVCAPESYGLPWNSAVVGGILKRLGCFEAGEFPWCHRATDAARRRAEALRPVIDEIQASRRHSDGEIAKLLNLRGLRTARGNLWIARTVCDLRRRYLRDSTPCSSQGSAS